MEGSPFLPLPEGMLIEQVQQTEGQLTVDVISTLPTACCPQCSEASEHMHSHYTRTVKDLPSAGQQVRLRLRVRKFFCLTLTCPRRIFTERLPDFVKPWARLTTRLLAALQTLGLATSGEVSERIAPRLGLPVTAPSLLRYLRALPDPPATSLQFVGLDDWAYRRGQSYGTLFVNLETRRPIEIVSDRTAEAVEPWLVRHPEIQLVTRDRASAYAEAVSRVLPHATQVADAFHLVMNLREHLHKLLDHRRTALPVIEDTPLGAKTGKTPHSPMTCWKPPPGNSSDLSLLTYEERQKLVSRNKRYARYQEIVTLSRLGMSERAIARQLHVSREMIHGFLSSPTFPERLPGSGLRPRGASKLDPFLPYLREQWDSGSQNGMQLFREIREQGYKGSRALLARLIAEWRTQLPPRSRQGQPRKPRLATALGQRRLGARSASYLMISPLEKLSPSRKRQLEQLRQHQDLDQAYLLAQEFIKLLKERQGELLPDWLDRAAKCQISELKSFAAGIRRDYAAISAACSLPWNNGIVEGHVNRLKLLKRQMFGRAHLDLLRVKVLHAV